jgi:predicted dehydrogenase
MTVGRAPVRVGVVGLGSMGWRHVGTLSRLPGVVLGGLVDVDEGRTEQASAKWGAPGFRSYEELLDRAPLDALLVCTPPVAHAAPALAAIARGIHVFVEKPIARRSEEAAEIVNAASRAGVVGAMGYQWRAIDFLDEIREKVTEQRLGLVAGRSIGPSSPRPWFLSWEEGGGVLLELASHDIDLARAIGGEVASVQAVATDVPLADGVAPGMRSALSISMQYRSGALGAIQVAWLADGLPTSWAVDVITDRGAYYVVLDPTFALTGMSDGESIRREMTISPSEANVARFVEAARAGEPEMVFCSLEDGARTLEVTLACGVALDSGEKVPIIAGATL